MRFLLGRLVLFGLGVLCLHLQPFKSSSNGIVVVNANENNLDYEGARGDRKRKRKRRRWRKDKKPTPEPPSGKPKPRMGTLSVEELKGYKPNIVFVLLDDLGYHDVGYAEAPRRNNLEATSKITELAQDGIILDRHYAHWHCSPSRRSFLTGRLSYHTGERLSFTEDDHMDVRWTWITEKLQLAGYKSWFIGKGHLGFKSVRHLPVHRGFDSHYGLLPGSDNYRNAEGWNATECQNIKDYTTRRYSTTAVRNIEKHFNSPSTKDLPFFLYLSFQTPHSPLDVPEPGKYSEERFYKGMKSSWGELDKMMYTVDYEVDRIVQLLKAYNQWDNTFFLFISDNGGVTAKSTGSNWPFRGEKSTSFEGGMRVTGFLSGGFVPDRLKAGVDDNDDPPLPPAHPNVDSLSTNPYNPTVKNKKTGVEENVWGSSYPGHDSVNLMPYLYHPEKYKADSAHSHLILSTEAILMGNTKLIVAQPCAIDAAAKQDFTCKVKDNKDMYGWRVRNSNAWVKHAPDDKCVKVFNRYRGDQYYEFEPCLFNLESDPQEKYPINDPETIAYAWKALNDSLVYQYTPSVLGKEKGLSPAGCLGKCNSLSVAKKWFRKDTKHLPRCGLEHIEKYNVNYC